MSIELDIARRNKIDEVVDLPSAIAAAHIFIRTGAPGAALLDRLDELGVRSAVKEHFDRLKADPDFDQAHAMQRIIEVRQTGGLLLLTGPGGSGKTELFLRYKRSHAALDANIVVTASTNQAKNVLRSRGEPGARTFHEVAYGKPGFDPVQLAEIVDYMMKDGKVELSPAVHRQLASAWRAATFGARERAAREVAGLYAGEQQVAKALARIGIAQGLMAVLKPMWSAAETGEIDLWVIDEASMLSAADVDVARDRAPMVLLIGDPFQLPAVIDEDDMRAGARPALAAVSLDQQVHLWNDRRVKGGSRHLVAANLMLSEKHTLTDLMNWARTGKYPGLTLHDTAQRLHRQRRQADGGVGRSDNPQGAVFRAVTLPAAARWVDDP